MGDIREKRIYVCSSDHLKNGDYVRVECNYSNEASSLFVLRYLDQCFAYLNLCVHMPRPLDCELKTVFDQTGKWLRCSMHGIVYDPVSGKSVSTMCNGEKLTAIRIVEDAEGIWIADKRVKII